MCTHETSDYLLTAMNPLMVRLTHCTMAPQVHGVASRTQEELPQHTAACRQLSAEPHVQLHQTFFLTVPDSLKHLLQLTLLVHFFNYVCTAYELPLDVQLQNTKSSSCFSHTGIVNLEQYKLHLHSHVQCHARIRGHETRAGAGATVRFDNWPTVVKSRSANK